MPVQRDGGFGVGSLVWIPSGADEETVFTAGRIVQTCAGASSSGDSLLEVQCEASRNVLRRVHRGALRARFARDDGVRETSPDSTALVHMNDASILENLRLRYEQDEIYTYTASVLLALNPYREIDGLYGEAQCELYRGKHIGALPPHPYAVADTAYRMLTRERKNQGIYISGESGAGKTESAKIVMGFLAYCSGSGSDVAAAIQAKILQAQPILESFGNAATLRNSNSSRFGKYNRVFFDEHGKMAHAAVTTYLLESSRVVVHADRERTYHVFYEMLAGLGEEKLAHLGLQADHPYRLLSNGAAMLPGFQAIDRANFRRLCEALQTVGFGQPEIDAMLQLLAGLVHLSDVAVEDEQGAFIFDEPRSEDEPPAVQLKSNSIEKASVLLGLDTVELAGTLRYKRIQIRGRQSLHEVARTASQFRQTMHAFIKAIYKRLFDQIVYRINSSFKGPAAEEQMGPHIGILDIYGFERLQRNSFEQLCINLANERLQHYFVENVLTAEQALYKREALPWTDLALPDSAPVVSCINSIFVILDDFSSRLARGLEKDATDDRFCEKLVDEAGKDVQRREILKKPRVVGSGRRGSSAANPDAFSIRHYAGLVEYNTKGWLDKNNDRLLAECEALIADSENLAVRALKDEEKTEKTQRTPSPFRSISKKYSQDLEGLLQTLSTCNLHYIRCFKPNEEKLPRIFKESLVHDQIVQCGTIELVKIMHDGYPNRCPLVEITHRFKHMLPDSFQRYGTRTFIEALMLAYQIPADQWALGMSRLFLKAGQLQKLEDLRVDGSILESEQLAKIFAGVVRKRWLKCIHAVRVCNYVPKLIEGVKLERAATAATKHGMMVAKIMPLLLAARSRVAERRRRARRRFRAVLLAIRCIQASWREVRLRRRMRVEKALHLAMTLVLRTRRWVAIGRVRVAEAERRRREEEEERKREAERRRREEDERRREEEERERMRLEEEAERRRLEKEEEQRRQYEERERIRLEEMSERERLKAEDERRRFEEAERERSEEAAELKGLEEQRRLEEDALRQVLEAEAELRRVSLESALTKYSSPTKEDSPQKGKERSDAEEIDASEVRIMGVATPSRRMSLTSLAQETEAIGDAQGHSCSSTHAWSEGIDGQEEALPPREEIEEQLRLEREKLWLQEQQMLELIDAALRKNEELEKLQRLDAVHVARWETATPQPESEPPVPSPANGPRCGVDSPSPAASTKSYSLLSGRGIRPCAVDAAWASSSPRGAPDIARVDSGLERQKQWWKDQRLHLLTELYPSSPQLLVNRSRLSGLGSEAVGMDVAGSAIVTSEEKGEATPMVCNLNDHFYTTLA